MIFARTGASRGPAGVAAGMVRRDNRNAMEHSYPILSISRPGRPPRVVLETSVVVSALMFGGGCGAQLRLAWQEGYFRPLLCKVTLLDLTHTLARPQLGFSHLEQQQLLGDYLPHALKVRVPEADHRTPGDEPAGLAFVRLAMAGKAHVLVTGDTELLAMQGRLCCQVMALEPFLGALTETDIRPRALRPR
jgi:predicted nucleic acid-binding protein